MIFCNPLIACQLDEPNPNPKIFSSAKVRCPAGGVANGEIILTRPTLPRHDAVPPKRAEERSLGDGAHGALNKAHHVCARPRVGERAGS
jgi:hypothetical protein